MARLSDEQLDAILDTIPDDLMNGDVAALIATIATAFSANDPKHAVMHTLNAGGMIMSKAIDETKVRH
jgi:hypothetical protein